MKLKPRNTLLGTRAEGQLLRTFWAQYIRARHLSADEKPFGSADTIFEQPILMKMHSRFQEKVLSTPAFFTERLSNRVLAGCLILHDGSSIIAINSRFKIDPEIMVHTLLEEFAHVQQRLDGVDFEAQRRQFAYHQRPYEHEAKQIAIELLGYEPDDYDSLLIREELPNLLDR